MPTKPVPIKLADGKDRVLRFDWEALCKFEEEFGYSVIDVVKKVSAGSISFLDITRAIWAGLLHEERHLPLIQIKKLLTHTDFFKYLEAVSAAITEAIPEEKGAEKNE